MKPRKLTEQQVEEIRSLGRTKTKRIDIAKQFNVSPQLISHILNHGYERKVHESKPIDVNARRCWTGIADEYNRNHPHDPLTPEQAKRCHDAAISRLRYWFRKDRTQGAHHESLL